MTYGTVKDLRRAWRPAWPKGRDRVPGKPHASQLDRLPRLRFAHLPTPLEPMDRLTAQCGKVGLRLWVKRDDCTGLATGGNKARKLEHLLGDATGQGADTLVTTGGLQSNHARQTAAAAALHGLRCVLVLTDAVPSRAAAYREVGNILLDRLLGADVRVVEGGLGGEAAMDQVAEDLRHEGSRPYVVPLGGSNGLGTAGYVTAFDELADQFAAIGERMDAIVVAAGSGGTQAGLVLGAALAGWPGEIIGVSVGRPQADEEAKVRSALDAAGALLGVPDTTCRQMRVVVDDGFRGTGYGQPTPEGIAAIRLLAETQGLLLDPVYTGKAMAGLLDRIRGDRFAPGTRNVVFLHTGGTAALGAYPDILAGDDA